MRKTPFLGLPNCLLTCAISETPGIVGDTVSCENFYGSVINTNEGDQTCPHLSDWISSDLDPGKILVAHPPLDLLTELRALSDCHFFLHLLLSWLKPVPRPPLHSHLRTLHTLDQLPDGLLSPLPPGLLLIFQVPAQGSLPPRDSLQSLGSPTTQQHRLALCDLTTCATICGTRYFLSVYLPCLL